MNLKDFVLENRKIIELANDIFFEKKSRKPLSYPIPH